MSTVFAPGRVKAMRFVDKTRDITSDSYKILSLEYLIHVIERVVISEKYILDRDLLVLDVKPETEKQRMKMALEGMCNGNLIKKITSSNRKPTARVFKGSKGSTSAYKRMYIRFIDAFDLSVLGGVS